MICLAVTGLVMAAHGQAVATTTVQGTVYLANGEPGGGTLTVSWPAFTTSAGQLVAADRTTVSIGNDGFVSINLAPNLGSTPAGQYYTAVFYLSDGTVNTQYWIVPAAAQATLAQVQAQVMPAAQAVQAVSKAYVDQEISELTQSLLTASGGNLSGPLFLNGDPTQPLQAADKHYVDSQVATAVPLAGGNMNGPLTTPGVNGIEAPAGTQQTTLQATMNAAGTNGAMEIPPTYAGTDTFTNPNGVRVMDMRTSVAQQIERSVKEFGAVCDGVTDDTNALQSAINYAQAHGVALTIPEGTCKTRTLNWHGESMGGFGKQVSALMGFPGQDVLATTPDNPNILSYTRLHDLTIYVDQSQDVSCSQAEGRAAAGSCQLNRPMESNTIFSPGGNGLKGTAGSGAGWAVGNCAIAMQAATGAGGNGLKNAQIENLEIVATGTDPMAAQYPGAHSTHTCGLYLAQWPQWSEFKNIDIRGLNTGVAIPALPVSTPAGLLADSNRWQNITIQATHGFTAAAGCNGILDDVTALAGNSAATGEPPTGIILDLPGSQEGWTVRNAVVAPNWTAVQPALTVTAASGAVSGVTAGTEHGLGWDPYGTTVPLAFSGSCTAQANAMVNNDGSIGAISVTQGGSGCSSTTTASINAPGNWDTAAPVNLIGGQNMTFFAGSLLRGNGGYTVWNATGTQSYGTQVNGGGGNLPGGGSYPAFIANNSVGSTLQVDQFPGANFGAKLQACVNAVNTSYGGTCDARNFTGSQTMSANLTISSPNTTILLPCATIATANQVIVTAGTRNVSLRGCAMRGGTAASGSQGGTAFAFSGTGAVVQAGDPTYAVDTPGFHMDNSVINTTGSSSATARGLVAYRTQEIDLEDMYFLGNSNQTGVTLDGTGNYTGGTIRSVQIDGFQTAVNAIGHQTSNPATTDWVNASTFVRLHIDCPTSNGNPIAGTMGINLQQGDGNTFTGGDVEGCSTALHLGANAQNNTIIGLRNENSTNQVVADAGSSYNNWITGGTMFTGQLTDNGTRNSFQDTFHRSFNGINGDWYGSQQDATVTNHFRLGIGAGNERGLLNEYQTDYGYRWTEGLSDATGGEQFYQILDQLNNVYRLSIGQFNNGQSSTNNQTAMNSAGTGAVVLNGTSNSGTGGVIFGSGGASPGTVATISNSGNAQFSGTLLVGGSSQSAGTMTVRNNADSEVDYYLWPGLTTSQKGSFTYKDWNGNSQWYMVKDGSNNWALNSAVGGLDSFKAYQSTNSGDTYIDASNSTGHIRLNYESGSGAETDIYSGSSANLVASFLGPTSIKFPGLAASSGHDCLQVDNSGYLTNTGNACGTGSGSGTVSSGNSGQIAYYTASGTTIAGISAVPVTAGGTGSTSAAGAMANLLPGAASDGNQGVTVAGNITAAGAVLSAPNDTTGLQIEQGSGVAASTVGLTFADRGYSSPDGAALDVFPVGYTPLTRGVVLENMATPATGCAICIGIAYEDVGQSQNITFTTDNHQFTTPSYGNLYATGTATGTAQLNWTGALGIQQLYSQDIHPTTIVPSVFTNPNTITADIPIAYFLAPDAPSTAGPVLWMGVDNVTQGDMADWQFEYSGAGSTSNYQQFGFSGKHDLLTLFNSGDVAINTNLDNGKPFNVNGSMSVEGSLNQTMASATNTTQYTGTSSATSLDDFLCPNITSTYCQIRLGVADSTGNSAEFHFQYAGSGSSSNYLGLGLYGDGSTVKIYGNGNEVVSGGHTAANYTVSGATSGTYVKADGTGYGTPAGSGGTVTSFSAGTLSPLFTTSVATPTSTAALTFALSNAAQNSVFAGPASGGAGAPSYQTAPTFNGSNITNLPVQFSTSVPAWLQNLGSGADGAETCNGNLSGEYYYTTFSVPNGNTCTINANDGLTIHATGACTINGTIVGQSVTASAIGGGGPGGSGGGTAAASAGSNTYFNASGAGSVAGGRGTAGGASGGSGTNGTAPSQSTQRAIFNSGDGSDGQFLGGGYSGQGGSSGGASANGGGGLVLICASITGSGTINLSGANGNNATGNNTGPSAGGGGGVFIASSQASETFGLTVNVAGGSAGSCLSYTGCGAAGTSAAGWSTEVSGW
jgi:hypothetical protein